MLLEYLLRLQNEHLYHHYKEQDMNDNVVRSHDVHTCPCLVCCAWRRANKFVAPIAKEDKENQ
jgi:hypothetical protein